MCTQAFITFMNIAKYELPYVGSLSVSPINFSSGWISRWNQLHHCLLVSALYFSKLPLDIFPKILWSLCTLRLYFKATEGYWSESFLYVAATLFCYNHGTHAVKCQYTLKQIIYVPIQTCTDNDITIHAHTCWYVPIHTLSIHTNISHSSEHHLKVEPQTLSLQDTALTALTALSTHGG